MAVSVQPRLLRIATRGRVGPRRWWWVRVHADVHELRDAAHRMRPEHGRLWWNACCGCCQPVHGEPANGYAGIIRYAADCFTAEVVGHELVHAAAHTYRLNVHTDLRLGTGCRAREEDFAYIFGELFNDLERQL